MNRFESITIREAESSDLETFYEHQLDPEAIRMAWLLTVFFCWIGPVWFYLIRNWTVFHRRLGGPAGCFPLLNRREGEKAHRQKGL